MQTKDKLITDLHSQITSYKRGNKYNITTF